MRGTSGEVRRDPVQTQKATWAGYGVLRDARRTRHCGPRWLRHAYFWPKVGTRQGAVFQIHRFPTRAKTAWPTAVGAGHPGI